jgi:ubiquinone/menaquinone biosynthesis C-methylase UbiE
VNVAPPGTDDRSRFLARAYSADAEAYDREWSPVIRPAGEALVRALVPGEARRVLDVGAGAGALTDAIRAAAPEAAVIGIDVAEGMLSVARARRKLSGIVAEAGRLPVASGGVDAVVLAYVLFHLLDPHAALAEAARILRRGGRVGTVTWAEERQTVAARWWDATLDAAGAPPAPVRGDDTDLNSIAVMERSVRRAGLEPERVFTETIDYTFEPRHFWRLRTGFGSTRWRLSQLEPRSRRAALHQLERDLAAAGPAELRFRGTVVLAVARRS